MYVYVVKLSGFIIVPFTLCVCPYYYSCLFQLHGNHQLYGAILISRLGLNNFAMKEKERERERERERENFHNDLRLNLLDYFSKYISRSTDL